RRVHDSAARRPRLGAPRTPPATAMLGVDDRDDQPEAEVGDALGREEKAVLLDREALLEQPAHERRRGYRVAVAARPLREVVRSDASGRERVVRRAPPSIVATDREVALLAASLRRGDVVLPGRRELAESVAPTVDSVRVHVVTSPTRAGGPASR